MANNESLDEQQKRQQRKKDNLGQLRCYVPPTQQMKTRQSEHSSEIGVVGRRGPATSAALILQTTATKDSAQS